MRYRFTFPVKCFKHFNQNGLDAATIYSSTLTLVAEPIRGIDRALSQLQPASMDGLIGRMTDYIKERKDEMKMTGQISFRLVLYLHSVKSKRLWSTHRHLRHSDSSWSTQRHKMDKLLVAIMQNRNDKM